MYEYQENYGNDFDKLNEGDEEYKLSDWEEKQENLNNKVAHLSINQKLALKVNEKKKICILLLIEILCIPMQWLMMKHIILEWKLDIFVLQIFEKKRFHLSVSFWVFHLVWRSFIYCFKNQIIPAEKQKIPIITL